MSIAKRGVKTPPFLVLSAISPFRVVNDYNSFSIDRIGQPMSSTVSCHRSEYEMCIYTHPSCKVFTIRVLIREWLKFVQIRWVLGKDALKRLLSSYLVQYLHFELWMIVTRSVLIELDNRCAQPSPFIVLNTKCAFIRTRDITFSRYAF